MKPYVPEQQTTAQGRVKAAQHTVKRLSHVGDPSDRKNMMDRIETHFIETHFSEWFSSFRNGNRKEVVENVLALTPAKSAYATAWLFRVFDESEQAAFVKVLVTIGDIRSQDGI